MIRASVPAWAVVFDAADRTFSLHGPLGDTDALLQEVERRKAEGRLLSCSLGHYGARRAVRNEVCAAYPDHLMLSSVLD